LLSLLLSLLLLLLLDASSSVNAIASASHPTVGIKRLKVDLQHSTAQHSTAQHSTAQHSKHV
jgi:hypothetical protein